RLRRRAAQSCRWLGRLLRKPGRLRQRFGKIMSPAGKVAPLRDKVAPASGKVAPEAGKVAPASGKVAPQPGKMAWIGESHASEGGLKETEPTFSFPNEEGCLEAFPVRVGRGDVAE